MCNCSNVKQRSRNLCYSSMTYTNCTRRRMSTIAHMCKIQKMKIRWKQYQNGIVGIKCERIKNDERRRNRDIS